MNARPLFSNAESGTAWFATWCDHCLRDHGMHTGHGDGCELACRIVAGETPTEIVPEPPGSFHLLPYHICSAFTPCNPCGGDPAPETRRDLIAHVSAHHATTTPPGDPS
jgi:hypothetical protein